MPRPGRPTIFLHGPWLRTAVWDAWLPLFAARGYRPQALSWPLHYSASKTSEQAASSPANAFRPTTFRDLVSAARRSSLTLDERPIFIGNSIGGAVAEHLLHQGLAVAAVAVDPIPLDDDRPYSLSQSDAIAERHEHDGPATQPYDLTVEEFAAVYGEHQELAVVESLRSRFGYAATLRPLEDLVALSAGPMPDSLPAGTGPLLLVPTSERWRGHLTARPDVNTCLRDLGPTYELGDFARLGSAAFFDSEGLRMAHLVLAWLEGRGL